MTGSIITNNVCKADPCYDGSTNHLYMSSEQRSYYERQSKLS